MNETVPAPGVQEATGTVQAPPADMVPALPSNAPPELTVTPPVTVISAKVAVTEPPELTVREP
ncbi:MAG: hypothetical protein LBP29_05965, partial [Treponema sp.]|nr:hypothetical protein [Treponema sp.]